jgi:hypothetical protein
MNKPVYFGAVIPKLSIMLIYAPVANGQNVNTNACKARPIKMIPEHKKEIVKNLYLSGIAEEFIAMQLDLEIPVVISILKELGVYKSEG